MLVLLVCLVVALFGQPLIAMRIELNLPLHFELISDFDLGALKSRMNGFDFVMWSSAYSFSLHVGDIERMHLGRSQLS